MTTYRYTEVNGTPHAFTVYDTDGLRAVYVVGSLDQLSGKAHALGAAVQTESTRRGKRTMLNKGSDFWTVKGHMSDRDAVAAIVNR